MKKVRIGILGCNYMGKMHADCYSNIEGVDVVAVADINEETVRKVAESCGAKAFTDAKELIDTVELDAIDICLPTFLHTEYAVKAMDKVPYVFIEKPVALNMEQCNTLLEKQKATGAEVQVGQVIRFWDEYAFLKKVVDSGEYGKVVNASFKRISPSPNWSSKGWIKNSKLSGGAIVDLHIHDVDFMLYLFGTPKTKNFIKNTIGEHNSYVTTICNYEDFCVSVEATWYLPPSYPFNMYYRVVFEKAVVEYDRGKLTVYDDNGAFCPSLEKSSETLKGFKGGNVSEQGGYINELKYFTDRIRLKEKVERATLSSAVNSLEFILDLIKEN
ncbi:MAG: Gfo/Idh/MocA family oxidoreductase [Clostridiales bacterium]|nr:Gfo/Idh/MocA family oxidoreductase [Clostridiales bacterium]MBE5754787.1 Gfo/Idh/MocA family oxidoreductase [Clostridiales bacterium]